MNKEVNNTGDYRSLLLLDEISKNESISQRDMSRKLGVALGLVNSYLKNLISKGHITISGIPRKRYRYYLTPKGFLEKTRLTYHHLHNFTNLYRVARKDFRSLFRSIVEGSDIKKVAFCGVDEVTEIAYLSLSETGLKLDKVFDDEKAGKDFFGHKVHPIKDAPTLGCDLIVITCFKDGDLLTKRLVDIGIREEQVYDISKGGWLNKFEREKGILR